MRPAHLHNAVALAALLVACNRGAPPAAEVPQTGLRRLSVAEYRATVFDLVGVEIDTTRLPADAVDPFDNDWSQQTPSEVLIEGYEAIAGQAADAVVADEGVRAELVGCEPEADGCLSTFIARFGRRALRRVLKSSEVDALADLATELADELGEPWEAVEVVLLAFLQHPELVYRVEAGPRNNGLVRLDDYQIATRMAYLLWGTAPDDPLLDRAEAGDLTDPELRREVAATMLADDRARTQAARFHAMWLGYANLSHSDLHQALRAEADAMVQRVVFDDQLPWLDVFTTTRTLVDADLAAHYGWDAPSGASWVDMRDDGRSGLLGTGAFLAVAAKFADTSPTQRGKLIRERLMCEEVQPPPPEVNADEPPGDPETECKVDAYSMHRSEGACAGCHQLLDPVGFGLEAFDDAGRYRTTELGKPDCPVDGEGEVVGLGSFSGPGDLAALLLDNDVLDACATIQLFRFVHGRTDLTGTDDARAALDDLYRSGDQHLDTLLLDIVGDRTFAWRNEAEDSP